MNAYVSTKRRWFRLQNAAYEIEEACSEEYPAFTEKDHISARNQVTDFKRTWDSSMLCSGVSVWLCRDFITVLAVAALDMLRILSSVDASKDESKTTNYDEVVNKLFRRYSRDGVTAKADEEFRNLKQRYQILWELLQSVGILRTDEDACTTVSHFSNFFCRWYWF